MRKGLTDIVFVIDKSGSMQPLVDDTIGGFNGFLKEQREVTGEARLTTILFSGTRTKLHERLDIREVQDMDRTQYSASGYTAMLDAIGETIAEVQKRIDDSSEDERPEKVVFVITTDGQENASVTYKKPQVQQMIEHQTRGHGWQFIFLGANMDAVKEASDIGIVNSATYVSDSIGTQTLYAAASVGVMGVRGPEGTVGPAWDSAVTNYTNQIASNGGNV